MTSQNDTTGPMRAANIDLISLHIAIEALAFRGRKPIAILADPDFPHKVRAYAAAQDPDAAGAERLRLYGLPIYTNEDHDGPPMAVSADA